jgi:hypothetical protein
MDKSAIVVKIDLRRRLEEIKEDIAAGRITFYNAPEEWTEKLLNTTAFNCVLLKLAQEAKWN